MERDEPAGVGQSLLGMWDAFAFAVLTGLSLTEQFVALLPALAALGSGRVILRLGAFADEAN